MDQVYSAQGLLLQQHGCGGRSDRKAAVPSRLLLPSALQLSEAGEKVRWSPQLSLDAFLLCAMRLTHQRPVCCLTFNPKAPVL